MQLLSDYSKSYLSSLFRGCLDDICESLGDYLALETHFEGMSFAEYESIDEFVKSESSKVSVHIYYKSTEVSEGRCALDKNDLKQIISSLELGDDPDTQAEMMVDVAKEFTNIICNQMVGVLVDKFVITPQAIVPVYREPSLGIDTEYEELPFGVLSAELAIGATRSKCAFSLLIKKEGLERMSKQIPSPTSDAS